MAQNRIRLAFTVIVALVLVPCLSTAQEAIKIGITAPITGALSTVYSVQGKVWDALEQVQNEAGGVPVKSLGKKLPIKLVYYDDKSDPKTSVRFYEKLINEDKVDLLMGPPGSPIAFAATTVAERYKFPMILGASNDPQIFKRGFKYIQGILDLGPSWSGFFFELLRKESKVKTVALLTEDVLYARGVAIGVRNFAKAAGMELVFDEAAPTDTADFTPIVTKMKAAKPDLVYVATFPGFFVKFAKQAFELGLKPNALHCSTCSAGTVRQALGTQAEGISGEVYWAPGMKLGDYKLIEAILQKTGLDPIQWTFALESVATYEVIREGIIRAGTVDRQQVFDTIKSLEMMTTMGRFKPQADGIGSVNPFPTQVQQGKVVVIAPPEAKTGEYFYPRR
jgi:ABC-type branched-subunit amino acid transport system substrate-binding protein